MTFYSCYNSAEMDNLSSAAGIPSAVCEVNVPAACEPESCVCPAFLQIDEVTNDGRLEIRKMTGGAICSYEFDEPGNWCLPLEGGGTKESSGTQYRISVQGIWQLNPCVTFTLNGSCSGEDLNMTLCQQTNPQYFWTEYHCLGQTPGTGAGS